MENETVETVEQSETNTDITETMTTETTDIEPVQTVDYTEQLQAIHDLLEKQNELLHAIQEGASILLVYGLIIVPLVFICIMLWWFFKQFLYNY